ncbi:MAG: hypothetical protein Q4E42_05010 [Phascolarctobacterium sp.]|nr:hypothetical protein [Phascolarctobacterium sp.]
MVKKLAVAFLLVVSIGLVGCGRSSEFGVVDLAKVESEAAQLKSIREEGIKELGNLQKEMEKALKNKSGDAKTKIIEDYRARAQVVQGNMANRMRNQLDGVVHQVAQKHGLGAVLAKEAVPDGGTDLTAEVLEALK